MSKSSIIRTGNDQNDRGMRVERLVGRQNDAYSNIDEVQEPDTQGDGDTVLKCPRRCGPL